MKIQANVRGTHEILGANNKPIGVIVTDGNGVRQEPIRRDGLTPEQKKLHGRAVMRARNKVKAKENFQDAFLKLMRGMQDATPELYDPMHQLYRSLVAERLKRKDTFPTKHAAMELARLIAVKDVNFTLFDMIRFSNAFETQYTQLWDYFRPADLGRSDDGYNDLMDSLPLVGRAGVEELLSISFDKPCGKELSQIVRRNCRNLYDLIMEGENYNRMSLDRACRKYYANRFGYAKDEEYTEQD